MAITYSQDDYTTQVVRPKRRPQPGDVDYVPPAGDPNAPLPPADETPPTSSTGDPTYDRQIHSDTSWNLPPEMGTYAPPGGGVYQPPGYQVPGGDPGATPPPPPTEPPVTPAATGPDAIITRALQTAYGRAPTQQDLDYWRGKWAEWGSKDPAYFEQRLLGMGAGGADAPTSGPYVGQALPQTAAPVTYAPRSFDTGPQSEAARAAAGGGGGTSDTAQGTDPFASLGGGTWVPGVGWYPTSNLTDEMRARVAGAVTPATPTTPTTPTTPAGETSVTQDTLDQERNRAILELLQRKPPTAEELRDTPENQAYQLQAQRAYERERASLAEGAQQGGYGDTGFLQTELSGLAQQRGEGEAGFLGQLAISRIQAQREDLQFAIDQARNSGQFDKAQALEQKRIELDAALRREQIASSEKMAANELALRDFLGRAGLDLDRLRLTQEGQQFLDQLGLSYDQLGYNYAALGLGANANAYNAITRPPQ